MEPKLEEYIRRFLFDQENENTDICGDDILLTDCPQLCSNVALYRVATATFYAPSELSGTGGLHQELIRSTPSWRNQYSRYDTVLVNINPGLAGMKGMLVGRVKAFLSFTHNDIISRGALVEWFENVGDEPDTVTGMWVVRPEVVDGQRTVSIVHLDSIVRAVHLVPVYRDTTMPHDFERSYSLTAFNRFYVNRYADYHSFECIY